MQWKRIRPHHVTLISQAVRERIPGIDPLLLRDEIHRITRSRNSLRVAISECETRQISGKPVTEKRSRIEKHIKRLRKRCDKVGLTLSESLELGEINQNGDTNGTKTSAINTRNRAPEK